MVSRNQFTNRLSEELRAGHIPFTGFVVGQDNQVMVEVETAWFFVIGSVAWHGPSLENLLDVLKRVWYEVQIFWYAVSQDRVNRYV